MKDDIPLLLFIETLINLYITDTLGFNGKLIKS